MMAVNGCRRGREQQDCEGSEKAMENLWKESRANYYIKRYVHEAQQRVNRMQFPDQELLEWVGCYAICVVDDESF